MLAVRPHLRACPACRAALRDYRLAPREVAAVLPVAALAGSAAAGGGPPGGLSAVFARVHEAVAGVGPQKVQAALDATWSGKAAAVAASTVALAGGGVAVERGVSRLVRPRPAVERHVRVAAPHRAPAARMVAGGVAASQARSSLGAPAGEVGHPAPTVAASRTAAKIRPRRPATRTGSSSTRRAPPAGEFGPEGPAPVSTARASPAPTTPGSTSARTATAAGPSSAPARSSSGNGAEFGF